MSNKIAFISDIHGNLNALLNVLDDIKSRKITKIYCAGDSAGYGSEVDEVLDVLRAENIVSVLGNNDSPTFLNLKRENSNYLRDAKKAIVIEEFNKTILLTHASPYSLSDYIFEDDEPKQIKIAGILEQDIIVFGHTHTLYAKEVRNKLFINAGSVGRPKDGDPRAGYVILDISDEVLVEFVRV